MEARAEIIASRLREWMNQNEYTLSDVLLGLSRVQDEPASAEEPLRKVDIEKLLRLTRERQMRDMLCWINDGPKPFYTMSHRLYALYYDVVRNIDRVWRKEFLAMVDDHLNGRREVALLTSMKYAGAANLLQMCEQSVLVAEVMWVLKSMNMYQCVGENGEHIDARECIDAKPGAEVRECIEKYLDECLVIE